MSAVDIILVICLVVLAGIGLFTAGLVGLVEGMGAADVGGSWPSRRQRWHFGAFKRCNVWALGPFMTDWRCLLPHDHVQVEGHGHIFEPDVWPGGRFHEEWVGHMDRVGLTMDRANAPYADYGGLP